MLALRPRPGTLRSLGRDGWRHGILIGLILSFSYLTQTYGLRTTTHCQSYNSASRPWSAC